MTVLNPFDVILSELADIRSEVRKLRQPEPPVKLPENLTVDQAIELLQDNGLPITLATLYKKTHLGEIPASRIGKRLVFSRKKLLNWIESRRVEKVAPATIAAEKLARSAQRRERARV